MPSKSIEKKRGFYALNFFPTPKKTINRKCTLNMYNAKQFEVELVDYIQQPGIYAGAKLTSVELKGETTAMPYYRFSFNADGRVAEASLFYKVDWKRSQGDDEKAKKENAVKTEAKNIRFVLALLSGLIDQKKIDVIEEATYDAYIKRLIDGVIKLKDKGIFNIKVIAKPNADETKTYCNVPANAGAVEPNVTGQSSTLYFTEYERSNGYDKKKEYTTTATSAAKTWTTTVAAKPPLPPFTPIDPSAELTAEGDDSLPF
jgi:hypothetical protein